MILVQKQRMSSAILEIMFSVDRDANAAVTARICSHWLKFKSLASFLAAKYASLLL